MEFQNFPKFKQFQGKTFLGIDYGTKVIGTALYCVGREPYPIPHERIIVKSDHESISSLTNMIFEEGIDHIVLGLPLHLDGNKSEMTEEVEKFGKKLQEATKIDIFYQDETLTSKTAADRMESSPQYNFKVDPQKIDSLSASIILEDFFKS